MRDGMSSMKHRQTKKNKAMEKQGFFKTNFAKFLSQYDEESYSVHGDKKSRLFARVEGEVLEVGPGTGVNFEFLKERNIKWTGIEPNAAMHPFLFKNAEKSDIEASLLECYTEEICLADNTMDYVISTEVLCSVTNLEKSLQEIRRVLRPGGTFIFMEHVVDKQNALRRMVQKIVPYTPWRYFSDGCHPARDISSAINKARFSKVSCKNYMREGSGIIVSINRPHIFGYAIK